MNLNLEMDVWVLLFEIAFIFAVCIQVFYYLFFYSRLAFYKNSKTSQLKPPVSIVIAARNEFDNLSNNLPIILEQDYPEFEVIVVNDGSWDDTPSLLSEFSKRYPKLKVVYRQENDHFDGGKKLAILLGIKGAEYNRLLFTDADCKPKSRNWIANMMEHRHNDDSIVLGYSPYKRHKGILNALIRFDNWMSGLNYVSFTLAKTPYMGVGRNLSYTKDRFYEVGGFKKHYHIKSGDDDLFVNQAAKSNNTFVCLSQDSIVETIAEKDWKSYWRQKKRHLSTSWSYKWHQKFLLAIHPLSTIIFFVSSILLLVFHTWMYIVLGAFIARILLQIFIFSRSSRWLGQKDLVPFAPFLEILVIAMSGFVHIANLSAKQTKWRS